MTVFEQTVKHFQKMVGRKNGGRAKLAEFLEVTKGQVTKWDIKGQIPIKHIPKLSAETGIPMHKYRPDVFPKPRRTP